MVNPKASDAQILMEWDAVNLAFEDKSTIFVIQMTADRCNVSYDRVVSALSREYHKRSTKTQVYDS